MQEDDFSVEGEPRSYTGTVRYSLDDTQQLYFPANLNQPEPIYFKNPRKLAILGICCEAIPTEVNYLIGEGVLTGECPNCTISYVHYFFGRHGLGKMEGELHADNCGA